MTVISAPPVRLIAQTRTKVLCDRHGNLDHAIAGTNKFRPDDNLSLHAAKRAKLAVKVALLRRVKEGDSEAIDYAQKREWLTTEVLAVAAE